MPQVVLRENGIIQNSTHPSQVFDYEVYVGDTLTVLLRADHPFNQGIEAEYKGNNLQQNLLSSNPLYSDAIVTPLNSTAGSFYNLDSNLVLFEWVPLRDNYFLGPKEVEYYFTFKDSTCSFPKRQSVTMRVQLKLKSTIGLLSNQPIATDTLSLCIYDSVNLKNLGDSLNFQWSHPDINNTNLSSQMEISFKPVSSAWLYITDTLGVKLDSVYLYYIPSSIVQLQHDNTRLTYNPQIAPVTPKNWLYNGAIPIYSSTGLDNMLIQGAGTYQWVYDASGDTCAQASSIETFANGPKWGAIFPTSEVILAQDYAAEFFFDFEVSARKDLDKIFIVGLVPKAINTYGTNQQRVIIELFEDNISIEKSTKFFLGTTELVSAMSSALEVGKDYRMRILLKAGDFYNVHKVAGLSYPFNSGDLLIKAVGHIDYAGVESPATSCPSIGLEFKNYVGREEKELSYLKVYPNPSENLIKVEFGERLIYAYEVLGTDGKLHLKGLLNNNEFIDISHLPKGIYYLKLGNGLSEKIVKN